jgi:hypothetical protein
MAIAALEALGFRPKGHRGQHCDPPRTNDFSDDQVRGSAIRFPYKSPYSAREMAIIGIWKLLKNNWLLR